MEGLVTYFTFHNQHPSKPQRSQVYRGELKSRWQSPCCVHGPRRITLFEYFFGYFIAPCGTFGAPYLGNSGTGAARAALSIPNSACSVFICPNNAIWLPVFGICTCAQILMQTTGPIPTSACSVFMCPHHGVAASAWNLYLRPDSDASNCTQELYIVMESALEGDSG